MADRSVDAYIDSFPGEVQEILREVRSRVLDAVPGGEERISYAVPTVTVDGHPVVHYAAWAKHLSLYPRPEPGADPELDRLLEPYVAGKGTLKFPLREPVPYDLVGRVAAALRGPPQKKSASDPT